MKSRYRNLATHFEKTSVCVLSGHPERRIGLCAQPHPGAAAVRGGGVLPAGEATLDEQSTTRNSADEKRAKHFNRLFLREDMQTANKHRKSPLASLEATVSHCLMPRRMATVENEQKSQVLSTLWENQGPCALLVGGKVKWRSCCGKQ